METDTLSEPDLTILPDAVLRLPRHVLFAMLVGMAIFWLLLYLMGALRQCSDIVAVGIVSILCFWAEILFTVLGVHILRKCGVVRRLTLSKAGIKSTFPHRQINWESLERAVVHASRSGEPVAIELRVRKKEDESCPRPLTLTAPFDLTPIVYYLTHSTNVSVETRKGQAGPAVKVRSILLALLVISVIFCFAYTFW